MGYRVLVARVGDDSNYTELYHAPSLMGFQIKGLGNAFTPDVEAAWSNVYVTLASAMQGGSGTPAEAAAILVETI